VKFLIICDSEKNILYVSKIHEGKKHDFKILEEELEGIDIFQHTIWVDLGFLGIAKKVKNEEDAKKINMPHKGSKNKPLTTSQKDENKQKASKRAVVENSIAGMKTFYLLKNRHRTLNLKNIEITVKICSGLTNLKKRYTFQNQNPLFLSKMLLETAFNKSNGKHTIKECL
jgi:hypothetical protein